jgi:hypothetical protein
MAGGTLLNMDGRPKIRTLENPREGSDAAA